MDAVFTACAASLSLLLQQQEPPPPAPQGEPASTLGVRYDKHGWPVVPEPRRQPGGDGAGWPPEPPRAAAIAAPNVSSGAGVPGTPVHGTEERRQQPSVAEPSATLAQVMEAVGAPERLRALGGVTVWWRLSPHGGQGEPIAQREITHHADLAHPARDRLEFHDGRIYGRDGSTVFAERHGMPWPTLLDPAGHELALLGLLLRAPWAFADSAEFAVFGSDVMERDAKRLLRLRIERRPGPAAEPYGPEPVTRVRDRFELLCEPGSLQPRELVYRLADSGQSRRMLLEDWREVGGLPLPFRRVLVDADGRPTTVLEIQRIEQQRAFPDSHFRLR